MKKKSKTVSRGKIDRLKERYEAAKRIIGNLMPKRDYDMTVEDIINGEVESYKILNKIALGKGH
jgi:hypothetical protein